MDRGVGVSGPGLPLSACWHNCPITILSEELASSSGPLCLDGVVLLCTSLLIEKFHGRFSSSRVATAHCGSTQSLEEAEAVRFVTRHNRRERPQSFADELFILLDISPTNYLSFVLRAEVITCILCGPRRVRVKNTASWCERK